jgi:hypothetical protein
LNSPRRFTAGVTEPWKALAARSPKSGGGKGPSKPAKPDAAPKGKSTPAPKPAAPAPAPKKAAIPAKPAAPIPPLKRPRQQLFKTINHKPERLALRQMGRGRKPPNLPDQPLLPPAPPSAPDFQGAAPTMHYGEAPVPPKKKSKKSAPARSTAAKAAEAARAAVWSVSSEKTTAQIEAAENAFEEALSVHKVKQGKQEQDEAHNPSAANAGAKGAKAVEKAAAKADDKAAAKHEAEPAPAAPRKSGSKDRWADFRDELARDDDPDDPHYTWRHDTGRPRHEMFLAADEAAVTAVEDELKMKLPPSYRDFNLHWGGGRLFTQEFREIRLVGALDLRKELKDRLCERMHSPWIPLADLGDGDYLAFDTSKPNAKGEYPVHWWYGGHAKKKVAASFQDWLEQLVASNGEAFWWEEA